DCVDVQNAGETTSGVYTVYPDGQPRSVYCDLTTEGGGWLVFLRRQDGSVDFKKNWTDYKNGFGDVSGEFWLGNELLHTLTKTGNVSLRVDMESFEGESRFAEYSEFSVGNEASQYVLQVAKF
ncbi:Ryncolin-1, partial [Lamellibrachia satsuma]